MYVILQFCGQEQFPAVSPAFFFFFLVVCLFIGRRVRSTKNMHSLHVYSTLFPFLKQTDFKYVQNEMQLAIQLESTKHVCPLVIS